MTSFNREKLIKESIESVLSQDYTDFEFIIVDDASTDSTWDIIVNYTQIDKRIKAFRNIQNIGDYPNRNRAASYATRKYLKYLDSDDIISEGALSHMVKSMEGNPLAAIGLIGLGLGLLKGQVKLIDPIDVFRLVLFQGKIIGCGPSYAIIKKSVFDQFGGFPEKRHLSDLEFWFQLFPYYPLCIFDESLVYWRRHKDQEFTIGLESNFHLYNSYGIYMTAINRDNCSLPIYERRLALRNLKNRYSRIILLNYLFCKFKFANQLRNKVRLNLFDLLLSILPNRYPKITSIF